MRKEEIEEYLSACEDYSDSSRLTDWEKGFILSIRDQFDRTGSLSERQMDKLDAIYYKLP